jgi:hypothetical protein
LVRKEANALGKSVLESTLETTISAKVPSLVIRGVWVLGSILDRDFLIMSSAAIHPDWTSTRKIRTLIDEFDRGA